MTEPLVPPLSDDWIDVCEQELPVDAAWRWVNVTHCGAFVVFCGTVRDYSEGRAGVTSLTYETYDEHVVTRLNDVAAQARKRWPELARLALLHRVGTLALGEVAVVVAASTPHRAEAFDAAQFCIDTLKETVPLWKYETWNDGADWSQHVHDAHDAATS